MILHFPRARLLVLVGATDRSNRMREYFIRVEVPGYGFMNDDVFVGPMTWDDVDRAICKAMAEEDSRSEARRVGKECRSRWSP